MPRKYDFPAIPPSNDFISLFSQKIAPTTATDIFPHQLMILSHFPRTMAYMSFTTHLSKVVPANSIGL